MSTQEQAHQAVDVLYEHPPVALPVERGQHTEEVQVPCVVRVPFSQRVGREGAHRWCELWCAGYGMSVHGG